MMTLKSPLFIQILAKCKNACRRCPNCQTVLSVRTFEVFDKLRPRTHFTLQCLVRCQLSVDAHLSQQPADSFCLNLPASNNANNISIHNINGPISSSSSSVSVSILHNRHLRYQPRYKPYVIDVHRLFWPTNIYMTYS